MLGSQYEEAYYVLDPVPLRSKAPYVHTRTGGSWQDDSWTRYGGSRGSMSRKNARADLAAIDSSPPPLASSEWMGMHARPTLPNANQSVNWSILHRLESWPPPAAARSRMSTMAEASFIRRDSATDSITIQPSSALERSQHTPRKVKTFRASTAFASEKGNSQAASAPGELPALRAPCTLARLRRSRRSSASTKMRAAAAPPPSCTLRTG